MLATKSAIDTILTSAQKEDYHRDGFLILKNFVEPAICHSLMHQAKLLIDNFNPSELKVVFTGNDQRHAKHHYFLESAHGIGFFFEAGAIDAEGNLKFAKHLCINKIGHALHDLDPVFDQFSRTPQLAALARDLSLNDPLLVQSMYICKQPHIGGEVDCHQDKTYLYTEKEPIVGLWFALEDATLDNGCLWAIPGGHRTVPLKIRSLRDPHDKITTEVYDKTPWPLEKMVPLEVPQGSLIVLHGLAPHMSKENVSSRSRHAYTLHLMSKNSGYPDNNWLRRPSHLPFKGF